MYELSRVRLYSIGPAGARYADTVLDLRGVGPEVSDPAPVQADFFEEPPPGPPRRPAPAGVLFLENGGGKSVLLKLIFSVMLPGHRNTLGGASSGVLRKFLLADDCGHVALEWQHTLTGESVVVGKASEWRGRQISTDPRKFTEAWYSFRPGPGLSLDSLPVAESTSSRSCPDTPEGASGARGRRRTMKGFRDALTETGKVYPHLDVVWEEVHERWKEHLERLGLDPELFRYQREMNADEGEAAGLFAVKNDGDFVHLLLRAVTDPRDTDGLADLVHGFAHKLGRRDELTAERDFTAGSLELLESIAESAGRREEARAVHREAEQRTRDLAARTGGRAAVERRRATALADEVAAAAATVDRSEDACRRAARVTAELAYRHASLALAAAQKDNTAQRRALTEAKSVAAAWQAAETVLAHRAAIDRAAQVADAIRDAERDAAPALAARTRAADRLVAALDAAADTGEEHAARREERAAALQDTADTAQREATEAATAAQRCRSETEHLEHRITEVTAETAEAVRVGWLDDCPGTDPVRAALEAGEVEQAAAEAAERARETASRTAAEAREAADRHAGADLAAARAADAVRATRAAHGAERDTAATLGAEDRVGALLGLAPGNPLTAEDLDQRADDLAELLETAVADAERQLFELRTAAAEDARMLAALGDGGLLPAGSDVLACVAHLGEHGIPALPGWRYLAQSVDPADHARVLATRPELVDGVVLTEATNHARAREILTDAALLPRSAVAVGTTEALLTPAPGETGDGGADSDAGGAAMTEHNPAASGRFLVPPNPALHDERAANTEREALRRRAGGRDATIRTLATRLTADRALSARLASWRGGCPAGRLTELADAADRARDAATDADRECAAAAAARTEANAAAAAAGRAHEEQQETIRHARRRADALAGLAFRLRERPRWERRLRELAEEVDAADHRAGRLQDHARAADEDRRAEQRVADDAHRTARALRAERAGIAGSAGPDSESSATGDTGHEQPDEAALPTLREEYRTAAQLYDKVGVGADLRAEQARAEGDESAARAALDRLAAKVRNRAAQLLDGPEGADGPTRQSAATRAEERVQLLERRSAAAGEELGRLRGEAERLAPHDGTAHTDLPEDLTPRDADHARELLRIAGAEEDSCRQELEEARKVHTRLVADHRAAEEAVTAFTDLTAQLRDLLREPQQATADSREAEPHPGSPSEVRQAAADTRRALRGCAAELATAETAVREAADRLVRHANSSRFEQVATPARQQIRELPASALPEHAAAWAEAFAPRLRVLSDELAQLEQNRDSIVARLRGLVEAALATLRSAQRLSRLPGGLGEWSGQEFLRIRFVDPDPAALTERLGEVIDETTRTAVRRSTDLRRDGMSLLLRGVDAGLGPREVSVEILKPDAVLRAERVPVGQMGDVFSGGQLLTAAIALYCTMAALRSNDRGQDEHRHAGTLFLDNPIGRANATYLLELQRAVADALGVQLLYTTGLFDTTALAEFPLVIRLRNDADLRAGLKYIRVEEHLRPGLPKPPADEDHEEPHSEISATRVFSRPMDSS